MRFARFTCTSAFRPADRTKSIGFVASSAAGQFGQWCADQLARAEAPHELLDSTASPCAIPNAAGRGFCRADLVGRSLRLGYFRGVRVLIATTPRG